MVAIIGGDLAFTATVEGPDGLREELDEFLASDLIDAQVKAMDIASKHYGQDWIVVDLRHEAHS